MKYFKSTEKTSVDNYPYGRLKATAFFSTEWRKGKGFRTVFQTINPKTGRVNNPKKGTYSPIIAMYKAENGHIKYTHYSFYDDEAKQKAIIFMSANFNLFTEAEIKDIAAYMLLMLKVDIKAKHTYCNSDVDKLLPLYDKAIEVTIEIFKTGKNLFNEITIDFDAVNALEEKNYNPFITTHLKVM